MKRRKSSREKSSFFIRPSIGIWVSAYNGNKDEGEDGGGTGGLVLGDFAVALGLLIGSVVGYGKRFGLYTGLMGAFALIPLLGIGFIGLPIGIHYKQRFGIGLIFPITMVDWWIGLIIGVLLFTLGLMLTKK